MASRSMWAPDGGGWRARIGVLTPDDDMVPESEFWTMAPKGVSVATARVPLVDVRTYSDPPGPDNAIDLLARLPLQSIVFAFTTTSYVLGTSGEQALTARLEQRSHGIPVLLPCVAATAAFRALAVRRIALFHRSPKRTVVCRSTQRVWFLLHRGQFHASPNDWRQRFPLHKRFDCPRNSRPAVLP